MDYRSVGNSGLTVSTVGLGCASFGRRPEEIGRTFIDESRAKETIEAAIEEGITLFDTSDSYGDSELLLAKYLGRHRDDVVIATKFGNSVRGDLGNDFGTRGSRRYVRRAVERSLRRLNTDWIDLYQMHSPDPNTPIEETLSVLSDLVHEGKVRYIGSSNLTAWAIADAEWTARTRGHERFVSAQNHYSLIARGIEGDIVPACAAYGIGLITLRPLGEGLLTGKYRRHGPPPDTTQEAPGDRRCRLRRDREPGAFRCQPRPDPARCGLRGPRRAAVRRVDDRGGHDRPAGAGQRGRGCVAAGRGGPGGDR